MSGSTPTRSDLVDLTIEMVNIESVSYHEQQFVDWLEAELLGLDHLEVERVGDNIVARTNTGCATRVVLAGHTDTVPQNNNETAELRGDELWGLGTTDMKGGLAIMLWSCRTHVDVPVDLTYVFYAREEVASVDSGLQELFDLRPDLMEGDVALLGEPTDAQIEAGCQGSIRCEVTFVGKRSHIARAWMGVNAIHRMVPMLAYLSEYSPRQPLIEGCQFHESFLCVGVNGGVSGNVVPDSATALVGFRFAPDRTLEEAEQYVREQLSPFLDENDTIEVVDRAHAAYPSVGHPFIEHMVAHHDCEVNAKLAWTDVARFAVNGIPAANFGPGNPLLAHRQDERLDIAMLESTWKVIDSSITKPPASLTTSVQS